MSGVFDTGLKQVQGDKAHDAADGGNPLKIGGKAATSTPSAVSDGDRVNAFFDDRGRQAVFDGNTTLSVDDGGSTLSIDDGGGAITVDGAVSAAGDVAHDAADSGNPLKIGGKAATSTPSAVSDGDRVNAFFDDRGRQAVFDGNTTLSVDDGGGAITVDGTVTAIVGGDTNNDAVDAGAPVKIGGVGSTATPSAVSGDGDRVNAWFDRNGRQAVFDGNTTLSVDDGGGAITVDNAAINADRQATASSLSTVRAASGVTGRYNTSNVDGHGTDPVLYIKDDAGAAIVINSASAAVTGSMGFGIFASTSTDVWYLIPMRNYSRLTAMITHSLDRDLTVTLFGFVQRDGQTNQAQIQLATAVSGFSAGSFLWFGKSAMATGGGVDWRAIPNIAEFDYIGIKCEVAASAPTSGGVSLLVSRDV